MGKRGIHYIIESSIGLVTDQLITKSTVIKAPVKNGVLVSDAEQNVIKIAVIERHHSMGNIGLGMIQGFGLKQGAFLICNYSSVNKTNISSCSQASGDFDRPTSF